MKSLIQRRIAIDRTRVVGIVGVSVGATGFILMSVLALVDALPWSNWIPVFIWLIIAGGGVDNLRKARHRLRAFEAEHGAGAGEQTPV
ncbi:MULTISPECIES: hypothetical protein [unclassified Microbacterium]|uniref:hypothetical protein n=1 Tax=unclassified Microbacterium TaxID=2609290 RepID=UPI000CFC8A63|nr:MULTISPECIES: hypothetical protein [unclassified Microbacterium]PQZ48522.1 hypothetical protein CQ032_20170 [Microbacterium sp. MYb43]PQZ69245.1 hypothetical protein CQ031_20120 [Microbacterium sp. MYb40]PRB13969.1 hypothetical protein CQ040_20195 [Microbacterium sp. MYb54]PRB20054.1 hypothetical protein CQ037_20115 [Microbacterium sp. MYb50]PRB57797.1 hypothetical protein CQ021_20170 [Microbacterium sp. MYb24]